ncbi:membrane-targeted effector domain-containing toxin [Luteibacter aegosomaticola]|uniref:membrane-targeted effector domain-containing toxin n=1 Tax=Luteibacter aegosomaticola TaxID=2911538 RepID=UPI001FFAED36|nr:membrane-targeted effector domain-containing toxin [Luteibacter aegosomaticola]UPG89228.1 membrane-targeted effector domain-containing toxin [Luteibacter aegosomaticola]
MQQVGRLPDAGRAGITADGDSASHPNDIRVEDDWQAGHQGRVKRSPGVDGGFDDLSDTVFFVTMGAAMGASGRPSQQDLLTGGSGLPGLAGIDIPPKPTNHSDASTSTSPGSRFGGGFVNRAKSELGTEENKGVYEKDGKQWVVLADRPGAWQVGHGDDGRLRLVSKRSGQPAGPAIKLRRGGDAFVTDLDERYDPVKPRDRQAKYYGPSETNSALLRQKKLAELGLPHTPVSADMDAALQREIRRDGEAHLDDSYRRLQRRAGEAEKPPQAKLWDEMSDQQLAQGLLDGVPGLVVGERHSSSINRDFLVDQMETFKKSGVTDLYLELRREEYGPALDALDRHGTESPELLALGSKTGSGASYLDVIRAAHKQGIRVHAVDSAIASDPGGNGASASVENRMYAFNNLAVETIKDDRSSWIPRGKFLVLAGERHVGTTTVGGLSIPGIANALGARSFRMEPPASVAGPRIDPYSPMDQRRFDGTELRTTFDVIAHQRS